MTPGEESEQQTTSQDTEILQLNLSSDELEIKQPVELTSAGEQSVGELSLTEVALKASRENRSLVEETQEEVAPEPQEPQIKWETLTVESGDSLAKIFKRKGYSASDLHYMMQSDEQIEILKKIRPGHTLEFASNDDNSFLGLRYPYSVSETLQVTKLADKEFDVAIDEKEIEFKTRFATATITSSFYMAGKDAGLPDGVIMELAGVFEYDIDFALEIRKDDSFSVLYEEKYVDGEKVGYGNILSAEFTNQGDNFAAVRYTDLNDRTAYYTPEGKALRKSFLRAPLQFNYVSSNFNPNRFHPIQKRVKPHRGVDYRAPIGTPVRAAGDGRVTHSAYNKYNGNYVFVKHGNNITTKYLHFSKRAVKPGERVKQGQIIGYVGSTGMSQAPHLHYEFVVNGVHRNPRTVKLPHAAPVPREEMERFREQSKPLLAQLETERTTYFARLNEESGASNNNGKLQK
ncbi:peptidoglycan DD-metalloendopeptidase family protein [Kangiella profundi]|nr:peptidoglycan DD-metalloendopeptidase family protein [Kangiella profundi]GGE90393.1 peptidase M23 [Kangiella profundi]